MTDLLTAVALIILIEGAIVAAFPAAPRWLYARLSEMPPDQLRGAGLGAVVVGAFALWLLRG